MCITIWRESAQGNERGSLCNALTQPSFAPRLWRAPSASLSVDQIRSARARQSASVPRAVRMCVPDGTVFVHVCREQVGIRAVSELCHIPPETRGQHQHLRGHAHAHRCCGKSLIGSALVGFGVRQHAWRESISKHAPSASRAACFYQYRTTLKSDSNRGEPLVNTSTLRMAPIRDPLCIQVLAMKVLSGSNWMLSNGKLFTTLIAVSR